VCPRYYGCGNSNSHIEILEVITRLFKIKQ
jgi:hypothetical protein